MSKLITPLQATIEVRNEYVKRNVANLVNIIFHTKSRDSHKADTQERVNEQKKIKEYEKNLKDDDLLLTSFDELIESMKEEEKDLETTPDGEVPKETAEKSKALKK